jgi:hypothetical protein
MRRELLGMLREAAQALVVMAATLALGGLGTWLGA